MEILTLEKLLENINQLIKEEGKDVLKKKVYLGDDEELNDVHQCYYIEKLSRKNPEDKFTYEFTDGLKDEKEDIILLS